MFWNAAWRSYIRFGGKYDFAFEILRAKYEAAVDRIPGSDDEDELAAHLMNFYWRGMIDLSVNGLVDRFFKLASPKIRRSALDFMGRSLINTPYDAPPAVADRFTALFDSRIRAADVPDADPSLVHDLAAFGSWFASARLDADWSMGTLLAVLRLSGTIDFRDRVITRLATIASARPNEVVKTLRFMIDATENWHLASVREQVSTILRVAIASDDPHAKSLAIKIIQILGERGDSGYQSLLP